MGENANGGSCLRVTLKNYGTHSLKKRGVLFKRQFVQRRRGVREVANIAPLSYS